MGRIKKIHNDVELARYSVKDTERLLAFNVTKKRIVDWCNKEFEDDPFDDTKNYSSWHRAMDGQDVWEGIVLGLDGLYDKQVARPRQYLPQDDPGDDLREWMAQIAKATWWHKTLQLDMSLNTLNSWFSGRVSKTRPELREKVDAWWVRVKAAADDAERYSAVELRDGNERKEYCGPDTWDTWAMDLIDDGILMDEVRSRFVEECQIAGFNHLRLIDLGDPQSPLLRSEFDESYKQSQNGRREKQFGALRDVGFPKAIPRTPPDFDKEPYIEERQWGDRRNEECPKDLNRPFYDKHYRTRCQRYWDAEKRCVSTESEIVQVSMDGEIWREANEAEKKDWDNGILFFLEAIHADEDTSNSYSRELKEAMGKEQRARREFEGNWDTAKSLKLEADFRLADRELKIARDNTHGQYY